VKNKLGFAFAILLCMNACNKQQTAIEAPPAPEIKAEAKPAEPAAPAKKPEIPTLEVTTHLPR